MLYWKTGKSWIIVFREKLDMHSKVLGPYIVQRILNEHRGPKE